MWSYKCQFHALDSNSLHSIQVLHCSSWFSGGYGTFKWALDHSRWICDLIELLHPYCRLHYGRLHYKLDTICKKGRIFLWGLLTKAMSRPLKFTGSLSTALPNDPTPSWTLSHVPDSFDSWWKTRLMRPNKSSNSLSVNIAWIECQSLQSSYLTGHPEQLHASSLVF